MRKMFFSLFLSSSFSFGMSGGVEVKNNDPLISSIIALHILNLEAKTSAGCIGTIISPKAILTAAHCLKDLKNVKKFEITITTTNKPYTYLFDPLVQRFKTKKYSVYPPYLKSISTNEKVSSDVAVIHLDNEVFPSFFRPIPLIYSGAIYLLPKAFQIYALGHPNTGQVSVRDLIFRKDNFDLVTNPSVLTPTEGGFFLVNHSKTELQKGDSGSSALTNRYGIPTVIGVHSGHYFLDETHIGNSFVNLNEPELNKWVRSQLR